MISLLLLKTIVFVVAGALTLPSCTFLSNRGYVEERPNQRGISRIVIFLQRFPCYRQLPGQNHLGDNFIKAKTPFFGPWEPAVHLSPRAVDVQEIDDGMMGSILLEAFGNRGYQPVLAGSLPLPPGRTVGEAMAESQAANPGVDAYLFCFYAPTLFVADPQPALPKLREGSTSLEELIQCLQPGQDQVVWAGPGAARAPKNSISHAFIYFAATLFRARDGLPLWQVADSQIGGKCRVDLTQCPPGPTDVDYLADAEMIERLMANNLKCRLRHLVPYAF